MTVDLSATLPFAPYQVTGSAAAAGETGLSTKGLSTAVPRFEEALRQASAAVQTDVVQVAQLSPAQTPGAAVPVDGAAQTTAAQPIQPVDAANESAVADARTRAAEGLGLERPDISTAGAAGENSGTSILNGLEQLRSVFDRQYTEVGTRIEGTRMDVGEMMALQAEVVKYSVLVDVSSKLAGKSTQAMDTLMKGQ